MMRVCHLNTCPVGIATQDPELRESSPASPSTSINFFFFIAEELREIMAELGFRTIDEMVGRVEHARRHASASTTGRRAASTSRRSCYQPDVPAGAPRRCVEPQDHGLERALDNELIALARAGARAARAGRASSLPIRNVQPHRRHACSASEIAKRYGAAGLPDDTIQLHFTRLGRPELRRLRAAAASR